MTDTWVRGQRSEPKIQTHAKVSAETEGKRQRKESGGWLPGRAHTVGRVEDGQTSKMTGRQKGTHRKT